jgi:predicted SnoaL-like aldol condensation-catalyzing enzyme
MVGRSGLTGRRQDEIRARFLRRVSSRSSSNSSPDNSQPGSDSMSSRSRKGIVTDFFHLIEAGRPKDGLKYFAADCVQHNPYVRGGMDALLDSMAAVQKEMGSQFSGPSIVLRHVVEEGDVIAVHTQILFSKSDPGKGGLRQVHVFRFASDDKIAEYWDITQMIQADMPYAANAF